MNAQQSFDSPIGSQVASQVSVPAATSSQVSKPATTGPRLAAPAQPSIKLPQDHCRNYLPHIENKRFQMITFRLNDSVPRHVVEQWKETLNHLTGSQIGSQAGSQVYAPAPTDPRVSTPALTESVSSSVGSETCRPIDSNPLSAGRETCGPTPNEKQ